MSGNTHYGTAALNFNNGDNNTAIGAFNSYNNTSGKQNTSVGSNALLKNTSGENNTAIGSGSMCFNTTGILNTAVGSSALQRVTAGSVGNYNIAVGASALYENTGNANVAVGTNSLEKMTLGSYNVAIGDDSGIKCTTYNYNTLLGALTDISFNGIKYSTAIGFGAVATESNTIMMGGRDLSNVYPTVVVPGKLKFLNIATPPVNPNYYLGLDASGNVITASGGGGGYTNNYTNLNSKHASFGYNNVFSGSPNVLDVSGNVSIIGNIDVNGITIGTGGGGLNTNTVLGYDAFKNNETGAFNVAIGYNAGVEQTIGSYNIIIGADALQSNSGEYNIAIGYGAGLYQTTGSNNILIGGYALKNNVSGQNNVAIGYKAGLKPTGASNNILIGAYADVSNNNVQNSVAIGTHAVVDTSNTILLGPTNASVNVNIPGNLYVGGTSNLSSKFWSSDNLKVSDDPYVLTVQGDSNIGGVIASSTGTLTVPQKIEVSDTSTIQGIIIGTSGISSLNINPTNTVVGNESGNNFSIDATENTCLGNYGMNFNSTGSSNTSLGQFSLHLNSTGMSNTAIGMRSALVNVDGVENTTMGNYSLANAKNSSYILAIGAGSGAGDIGAGNTWLGTSTRTNYATGPSNEIITVMNNASAIGGGAIVDFSNTIVLGGIPPSVPGQISFPSVIMSADAYIQGITIGQGGFYGSTQGWIDVANPPGGEGDKPTCGPNTAFGYMALKSNAEEGQRNSSFGFTALTNNEIGSFNTAFGYASLSKLGLGTATILQLHASDNLTGNLSSNLSDYFKLPNTPSWDSNSAFGDYSLKDKICGIYNCAFGDRTGLNDISGNCNTYLGANAGIPIDLSNQIINYSTAIGYGALVDTSNTIVMGGYSLDLEAYPTVIVPGKLKLTGLTSPSGSPNYYLGVDASGNVITANGGGGGYNNEFVNVYVSHQAFFGYASIDDVPGDSNTIDVSGNVNVVGTLSATQITFTSDYRIKEDVQNLADSFVLDSLRPVTYKNKITQKQDIGLIAHEVQEQIPFIVDGEKDADDLQKINYIALIPILIKEIKDLKNRIKVLEGKE